MPVHDVAARGFGREAQTYERSRPTYPPDAVAWLVEHLRIGPGARVGDLAAGTGKFTRLLTPSGAELVAIDPIEGMWQMLHTALPEVSLVAATAEALPFAAGAFDAITVAQGFHWFDAEVAAPELQRILRPGGSDRTDLERSRSPRRLGRSALVGDGSRRKARAVAEPRRVRRRARRTIVVRAAAHGDLSPRAIPHPGRRG